MSKVFDNDDFGYRKVTVERPLRLNFAATPERIGKLEEQKAFQNLAQSKKADDAQREAAIAKGQARQEAIRNLLRSIGKETAGSIFLDPAEFSATLDAAAKKAKARLNKGERAAILSALGKRDPEAAERMDDSGNTQPDPELRDTETVPLKEALESYMTREVIPHAPDAWLDRIKTKVGYEVPLNRQFYVYEAPRPLEEIESGLRTLESEIADLMAEVTT